MTSKNLFFKLIWQDFKKRIWCPILIFLAYFLGMELRLLNYLDQMERHPSHYDYTRKHYLANEFFAPDTNDTVIFLTIVAGVVCALSGYAYLHSKKQLDTWHSMPVKRGLLFWSRYVSGALMFVIPMAVHTLICLLLGGAKNAFSMHALINAIGFHGVQLLYFFLFYSIAILAVCLTGNMIISILGGCVLASYSSILTYLKEELYAAFFHAYLPYTESELAFSPIGMMMKLNACAVQYRTENTGFSYRCLLPYSVVILFAVLVFTLCSVWMYKKRATEAAGKPIAFGITEPFIKAMVVIPVSLFTGILIQNFVNVNTFGWFLFGVIFGFLVTALAMEIIFRLDMKCAFCHWKQLIFNGACLFLAVIVLRYDVLGYNTYVPDEKELSGCAVSMNGLLDISLEERKGRYGYTYISPQKYRFEHMNVIELPSAMTLARKAVAENLQNTKYDYYEGIEETPEYQRIKEKESGYRSIGFQYTKKNGKKVYRHYLIDISDEETLELLAEIFSDSNYKLGAFPILTNGWKREYSEVFCESNDFTDSVKLSPERQARLLEVYQSDLLDLTLDEVMNELPLGNITFKRKGYSLNDSIGSEDGYKIYPSFTATIALLKEYGFDYTKELTAEQTKEIRVSKYCKELTLSGEVTMKEARAVESTRTSEVIVKYTDTESKEAILSSVVNRQLLSGIGYFDIDEAEEDVVVYYDEDGVEVSKYFCFCKENKPEFIDADIEKRLEEMKQERLDE